MNYLKKNPLFFGTLTSLLLAFVVAFVWNIILFSSLSAAELDYDKTAKRYKKVQSQDPSQDSVNRSDSNIKEVNSKLNNLVKELSPNSSNIIKPAPMKEGYSYVEYLRGLINKLRADAFTAGVFLNADECFGYSKFYKGDATPPPDEAVAELWKQSSALAYIMEKLYSAKISSVPMKIDLVQREILPIEIPKVVATEGDAKVSRFKTRKSSAPKRQERAIDTFEISKNVSAKVPGSIDTFAYRFTFRTKTDVLRNFLNSLKDFDLMLVVRSVDVSLGLPLGEALDVTSRNRINDGVGSDKDAAAESSSRKKPIVEDSLSEFSVIIEYVELSKEEIAARKAKKANQLEDEYSDDDE